ncbi:MAG: PP2C family protein-serine/threonine phosphatase, partial [Ilumatobacteraceae bacterium]
MIVRIRASLLALVAVSCAPAPIAVVREAIPTPVTTVPTAPVSDDGSGPDADADTGAEPEFDAGTDTGELNLRAGDRLLLCSDGLSGVVEEHRIASALKETPEPQACATSLMERAL